MHTHGHFLHVLYFLGTHLKWLPILHTLMRVLSCIVCCHAILPHNLLSPINALWTQQWHIIALPPILLARRRREFGIARACRQHKGVVCAEWLPPLWLEAHAGCAGMLTACKLGLAGSDASACTPSTSIVSGAAAAAAGLAAHTFCAAGCAGALLKKPNMLCWPCLALLPACHSLLHFSACSSLLNLLLNSLLQPTTGHFRSSMMTFQTECYPQSSSRHNSSTVPPDTSKRVPIDSS